MRLRPGMVHVLVSLVMLLVGLAGSAEARCARSHAVRAAFQRLHPCPSTGQTVGACPGYVFDHIVPLCAGGADSVANLQYQTIAAGKIKDRAERALCRKLGRHCFDVLPPLKRGVSGATF
jgi:hypothetical protein